MLEISIDIIFKRKELPILLKDGFRLSSPLKMQEMRYLDGVGATYRNRQNVESLAKVLGIMPRPVNGIVLRAA